MKRFLAVLSVLIILAVLPLTSVPVKAQTAIYIRADGTVEGTGNIQLHGNVYSFTSDIVGSAGITVEKDNVIIDGKGFSLVGLGVDVFPGVGLDLTNRSNVVVENLKISEFVYGISNRRTGVHDFTRDSMFIGNSIDGNGNGISFYNSINDSFSGNSVTNNQNSGIEISTGSDNALSGNRISGNKQGIYMEYSNNNQVSNNVIINNGVIGIDLAVECSSNVFSGNTVENNGATGNPEVDIDIGGINVVGANNQFVGNLIISNNNFGLLLFTGTSGTVIRENNVTDNSPYDLGFAVYKMENGSIVGSLQKAYDNNLDSKSKIWVDPQGYLGIWDNGTRGNHWNDYSGVDSDNDGVGDTPYLIDSNNKDNFPLMQPVNISEAAMPSASSSPSQSSTPFPTLTGTFQPSSTSSPAIIGVHTDALSIIILAGLVAAIAVIAVLVFYIGRLKKQK